MQLTEKHFNPARLEHYIVLPRERSQIKAMLAPLPVRDIERAYKKIAQALHMCEENQFHPLDRVRFCAFKNALALVRMTSAASHVMGLHSDEEALCKRHLKKAKDILDKYDARYAAYLAPLTNADMDVEKLRNGKGQIININAAGAALYVIDDSESLALHDLGLRRMNSKDIETAQTRLAQEKATLQKFFGPRQGLLTHLKPW